MANKSRSNLHEATEEENSPHVVETEEDSEEEEIETMGSEEETTEDPEEISVTDPRDVSTAERKAISPRIALNVIFYLISARKPREFNNRDRPDRGDDRGGYKRRSRSRSGDRHKKHRRRSSSNSSRDWSWIISFLLIIF